MTKSNLVVPPAQMYNPVELKKVLDLGLEDVLSRVYKYEINNRFSNTVILCSFVCAALGVLAWYFPKPWPESYWYLVAIVVVYVLVDGYLTVKMWFTEKGFAVETRNPDIRFYSEMVRYTPTYLLRMKRGGEERSVEISVDKVFDTEGNLLLPAYEQYISTLVNGK